MSERIWNGTVVRERGVVQSLKGVVISQTDEPDKVVVRWEGGAMGEWEERIANLEVVLDEKPVQDGTRAYKEIRNARSS